MKCLVVVAHPLPKSLSQHFAGLVVERLVKNGHTVQLEDLYLAGFAAALSSAERESYYANYDASQVAGQCERLLEAEALILIFPTWWFGFPAILKGWFDRVWGPGIAYDHADDFGPIKPRLRNLKNVVAITTLGSAWWIDRFVMWRPVKRNLKYALLGACAGRAKLKFLSLYASENVPDRRLRGFERKIVRAVDHLPSS